MLFCASTIKWFFFAKIHNLSDMETISTINNCTSSRPLITLKEIKNTKLLNLMGLDNMGSSDYMALVVKGIGALWIAMAWYGTKCPRLMM